MKIVIDSRAREATWFWKRAWCVSTYQIFFQLWAPQKNLAAENVGNQFFELVGGWGFLVMYLYFSFRSILCIDSSEIWVSTVPHAFQVLDSISSSKLPNKKFFIPIWTSSRISSSLFLFYRFKYAVRVSYLYWRRHRIVLPLGIDCV